MLRLVGVAVVAAAWWTVVSAHNGHYHDLDIFGRKLFNADPAQSLCPAWYDGAVACEAGCWPLEQGGAGMGG